MQKGMPKLVSQGEALPRLGVGTVHPPSWVQAGSSSWSSRTGRLEPRPPAPFRCGPSSGGVATRLSAVWRTPSWMQRAARWHDAGPPCLPSSPRRPSCGCPGACSIASSGPKSIWACWRRRSPAHLDVASSGCTTAGTCASPSPPARPRSPTVARDCPASSWCRPATARRWNRDAAPASRRAAHAPCGPGRTNAGHAPRPRLRLTAGRLPSSVWARSGRPSRSSWCATGRRPS